MGYRISIIRSRHGSNDARSALSHDNHESAQPSLDSSVSSGLCCCQCVLGLAEKDKKLEI